jgi:hypothetical protein
VTRKLFSYPITNKPTERLSRFTPTKVTPAPGTKQEKAKSHRLAKMKVTKVPMPWDEPEVQEPEMPWLTPKGVVDVSKLYSSPGDPFVYRVSINHGPKKQRETFRIRWVTPRIYRSHLDDPDFKPEVLAYIQETYDLVNARIGQVYQVGFWSGPGRAKPSPLEDWGDRPLTKGDLVILRIEDYVFSPRLPETIKTQEYEKLPTIPPVPRRCATCLFFDVKPQRDGRRRVPHNIPHHCAVGPGLPPDGEIVYPFDGSECKYWEVVPEDRREGPKGERWKPSWHDEYLSKGRDPTPGENKS